MLGFGLFDWFWTFFLGLFGLGGGGGGGPDPTPAPTLPPTLAPVAPRLLPTVSPTKEYNEIPKLRLTIPNQGHGDPFDLDVKTLVTIPRVGGEGFLCSLIVGDNVPVALTYDGNPWERAGGAFAAKLPDWTCNNIECTAILPRSDGYKLITRTVATEFTTNDKVVRFLESASFGVNATDLDSWSHGTNFEGYVQDQIDNQGTTSHRAFFRSRANPLKERNTAQFDAHLEPCAANGYWQMHILTERDRNELMYVNQVDSRWEISINNVLRSSKANIPEFANEETWMSDTFATGMSYKVCSNGDEIRRGIYRVENENGSCRRVKSDSMLVEFPAEYRADNVVTEKFSSFSETEKWQNLTTTYPLYRRVTPLPSHWCSNLPAREYGAVPVFAEMWSGDWLQFYPRMLLRENTLENPLKDGGHDDYLANNTFFCHNAPRSYQNEEYCYVSKQTACYSEAQSSSDAEWGTIVCGSPNEVANDPTVGDNWLDLTQYGQDPPEVGFPPDYNEPRHLQRQREFIWSEVALKADDQLRQKVAWVLFQIFALPKGAIDNEFQATEIFLHYYDIFVRNAFGNYRDVLQDIALNPLMSQSLTFLNGRPLGVLFRWYDGQLIYPDENFARELMQLFTIGLVKLNMDGTPVLDDDENKINTYDSNDILEFAKPWTGFFLHENRANIEGLFPSKNRIDPLKIDPEYRDRFPKSNLLGGYIGDGYPLCHDLPTKHHFRKGARYRALGRSRVTDILAKDPEEWARLDTIKRLSLRQDQSGLYELLCGRNDAGSCTYPGLVVLEEDIACSAASTAPECLVDTFRIVEVASVYYEYVPPACVQQAFIGDTAAIVSRSAIWDRPVCVDNRLLLGGSVCCEVGVNWWEQDATIPSNYVHAGERMSKATAEARCTDVGREVCDFRKIEGDSAQFPKTLNYYWNRGSCETQAKINKDGQVAIVHYVSHEFEAEVFVRPETPSYFRAFWDGAHPTIDNSCGGGACDQVDDACLCNVTVAETAHFGALPENSTVILNELSIGHLDPSHYGNEFTMFEHSDYRYYSKDGNCCSMDAVYEVTDWAGEKRFFKNLKSTVRISEDFTFRNAPHFNSIIPSEYSVKDALYENEAVLDHLFYHTNTPPFVAYRFIQRFGISNPTPRYVKVVATAFRDGSYYSDGTTFGTGKYGDLAATVAAVLLDREARSTTIAEDPSSGSLREPILKVVGFIRAMHFNTTTPLTELDLMDVKIGQMAYEQASVFSFFRPEYSPPGDVAKAALVAPEAEILSAGRIVGILNGLYQLTKFGLGSCGFGFGTYDPWGNCKSSPFGQLEYRPPNLTDRAAMVGDLNTMLVSGRLSSGKQDTIVQSISSQSDDEAAFRLALQLIVSSPEFHSTNLVDEEKTTAEAASPSVKLPPDDSYKAVIHLSLNGGADSFNMLAPHTSCNLYQSYSTVRGGIALDENEMLRIAAADSGQICDDFGIHHRLELLEELYNDEDLLFFANTGVLTQPATKEDYQAKTITRLFSHNAMWDEVNALDPSERMPGSGTLGRMAEVLEEMGYRVGRTAVEATPRNLASSKTLKSSLVMMGRDGVTPYNSQPADANMDSMVEKLNGGLEGERSGVFGELWSESLTEALDQTDTLYDLLENNPAETEFEEYTDAEAYEKIAQMIRIREDRGVDRDFFFINIPGYDHHFDVTRGLNTTFTRLNKSLTSLVDELKLLNVWDKVTIIQTSDFGRTLSPNFGGGTDHGWGGQYFLAGGPVKGKRILGEYIDTFDDSGEFNIERGRVVPSTPWEAVFNGIAKWTGVSSSDDLYKVLPQRDLFSGLFEPGDLFK